MTVYTKIAKSAYFDKQKDSFSFLCVSISVEKKTKPFRRKNYVEKQF